MNGQIRVQSELGKGTIFGIELPFEHASATPGLPKVPLAMPAFKPISNANSTSHLDNPNMITTDGTSPDFQASDSNTLVGEPSSALSNQSTDTSTFPFPRTGDQSSNEHLTVLIAEDNPVNAKVLTRRLQKLGHEVLLTVDGQQCHDHFALNPQSVNVILMDIQVRHLPHLLPSPFTPNANSL